MKLSLTAFAGLLLLTASIARAEPLEVGTTAPVVTATDQDGKPVDFGAVYAQGMTLVYFYPKANTAGCTAQACSLRDSIADLKGEGVTILGVSADTPEAQMAFKKKYSLPFTLIADPEGKVMAAFGVSTGKAGMAKRQSFLVRDGQIVWRSLKAETRTHAAEVEKAIADLKG